MVDVISLRLSEDQMKAVDDIVQSGEFGTRAEFVKYCVRMTLKSYAGRSPPPAEIRIIRGARLDAKRPFGWIK